MRLAFFTVTATLALGAAATYNCIFPPNCPYPADIDVSRSLALDCQYPMARTLTTSPPHLQDCGTVCESCCARYTSGVQQCITKCSAVCGARALQRGAQRGALTVRQITIRSAMRAATTAALPDGAMTVKHCLTSPCVLCDGHFVERKRVMTALLTVKIKHDVGIHPAMTVSAMPASSSGLQKHYFPGLWRMRIMQTSCMRVRPGAARHPAFLVIHIAWALDDMH
jgi:hypothetical protein